nr:MAG TPA: Extracellular lipase [Caudoviricetes sp.]
MITDVELLNCVSLGYLEEFGKSEHGKTLPELLSDKEYVTPTERSIYWNYKLNGEYIYRKHLKDWKLLYTSDFNRVCKEYLLLNEKIDNGFRATIWRKGNNLVLAYTGTNDIDDMLDDIDLAYNNNFNDQLSAAFMLFKYTEKYFLKEDDTLYICGHSLGGALAQFVYACTSYNNKRIKLVTYNGLGIGVHKGDYIIDKPSFTKTIQRYLSEVPDRDFIIDEMWNYMYEGHYKDTHPIEDKDKSIEYILTRLRLSFADSNIEFGFMKMVSFFRLKFKKVSKDEKYDAKVPIDHVKYVCNMIYYMCYTSYLFHKHHMSAFYSTNGSNYYFSEDWVPRLQTSLGVRYCLDKGDISFDVADDSKTRIIKATIKNVGFKRHSVGLFIMYVDVFGNIKKNGIMNLYMLSNMYKELIYSWFEKERILGREHTYMLLRSEDGRNILYVDKKTMELANSIERDVVNKAAVGLMDKLFTLGVEYKESIFKCKLDIKENDKGEVWVGYPDNFSYMEVDSKRLPLVLMEFKGR